jgi:hypothetical protein
VIVDVLNKYNVHGLPMLFIPKWNTKAIEKWLIEIMNEINIYVIDDVGVQTCKHDPHPHSFVMWLLKKIKGLYSFDHIFVTIISLQINQISPKFNK